MCRQQRFRTTAIADVAGFSAFLRTADGEYRLSYSAASTHPFISEHHSISGVSVMNQAIVDPSELRRFAQSLRRFNEDLSDRTAGVSGQLSSLAQTWRDKEHLKFAEDFSANMKA
ncbi:MAG TPA: hypothetical protein EYG03_12750, partial [Planctomycetes bacterium]|nr:hypothetical protein [Planctomycetota bacterium]